MKKKLIEGKKDIIIIVVTIVIVAISVAIYLGVNYYLGKDLERQKQELQETIDRIGVLERETVEITVAKFNTQIMDNTNWELLPVNDDYMEVKNETYWYPIYEDILLAVQAEEFTNDKSKDISKFMLIQMNKDSNFKNEGMEYVKYLIKANNEEITDSDVTELLTKAQELKEESKTANNGRGINVGIYEYDSYIQYQITRIY